MTLLLAAATLVATLSTNGTPPASRTAQATSCSAYQSVTTPPRYIRVLDGQRVIRVRFMTYVGRVVSSEWNTVPEQLRLAGAVAVKQYGWYKTMHPRASRYGCFDVHSDTKDQIYRVKSPPDYVWEAVERTWGWRVMYEGRLIQTGYRTGQKVGCAQDVDGYHLFARSGAACARAGWGAVRILDTYYRGRVIR